MIFICFSLPPSWLQFVSAFISWQYVVKGEFKSRGGTIIRDFNISLLLAPRAAASTHGLLWHLHLALNMLLCHHDHHPSLFPLIWVACAVLTVLLLRTVRKFKEDYDKHLEYSLLELQSFFFLHTTSFDFPIISLSFLLLL